MGRAQQYRPPVGYTVLLRVISWLVGSKERPAWRARQDRALFNYWVLRERGELTGESARMHTLLAPALRDAFPVEWWRAAVRSPWAVVGGAAALFGALAVLSGGFAYTRHLVMLAAQLLPHPPDLRSDVLAGHGFVLTLSLIMGIVITFLRRPPRLRAGARYGAFFAFKVAAILLILPAAWMEAGAGLRAMAPQSEGVRVLATLVVSAAYVGGLACALCWAAADQRARCPVCLRALVLPVSLGSPASMFEPRATESLCEAGHGALLDDDSGEAARWTRLDPSWQDLFAHTSG